ncbi:hypothetical protein FHW72_000486 [Ochrobactrum sp. RC6B]|uniref:LecA/PA-IL family lectin n=1 Tax=Brucella sp. NBRC 14130 TaxID=3075483 RepID=UPI000EFAE07A|nr:MULTISPECIES: LecA/PA-IL family lectin [Brucella/Ochrobactrum group]MBA8842645.1 hypothetical protein [Ochrobactrum sp. RH1CCR137]MBA8854538.1 hypothetical protein [Ochrobactrum sp. RH1CCR134]MBB3215440.1 hypothetical protein [Ochrobactrum sp. RC6B]
MVEKTTWTGIVPGDLAQGQKTGIQLKKGDLISVAASGYVKFGPLDIQWADPSTYIPPYGPPNDYVGLVATFGDDKTRYPIGTGVLNWSVPINGELTFLFNDRNSHKGNTGFFEVTAEKQRKAIVTLMT